MKRFGVAAVALLAIALFVPKTAGGSGDSWTFNLFSRPVAVNINSPGGESISMTGAGVFGEGLVLGGGAYELFNAGDHPNGPIVRGTWYATKFVSFENGLLIIEIATLDNDATEEGTGTMWITEDGIAGPIYAEEPYRIPADGSGGGAKFHRH